MVIVYQNQWNTKQNMLQVILLKFGALSCCSLQAGKHPQVAEIMTRQICLKPCWRSRWNGPSKSSTFQYVQGFVAVTLRWWTGWSGFVILAFKALQTRAFPAFSPLSLLGQFYSYKSYYCDLETSGPSPQDKCLWSASLERLYQPAQRVAISPLFSIQHTAPRPKTQIKLTHPWLHGR